MARMPRLDVPGVTQHVIQRGNNRQPCLFRELDYQFFLENLAEYSLRYGCRLHAYVLMTNHVHLLVTPEAAGTVGRMMQAIGRRYVRCINDGLERSGSLWEGRYRACLVDNERYVLSCYRYIELNPVRAGLTAHPADYPWSSHHANALGLHPQLVCPHPAYLELAKQEDVRRARYRELFASSLSESELDDIRSYTQSQLALGSLEFQNAIESKAGRRAGPFLGRRLKPAVRPHEQNQGEPDSTRGSDPHGSREHPHSDPLVL